MESKRENYRKYLESGKVMDALTKALVSLYEEPEQPEDPLNYIRQCLGASEGVDVDALVRENQELKEQIQNLTKQIEELEAQESSQSAQS